MDGSFKVKCLICKHGETQFGETTVTMERGVTVVIIKGVPADICDNCGEYYLTEEMTDKVQLIAEEAFAHGEEIEVRRFAA